MKKYVSTNLRWNPEEYERLKAAAKKAGVYAGKKTVARLVKFLVSKGLKGLEVTK